MGLAEGQVLVAVVVDYSEEVVQITMLPVVAATWTAGQGDKGVIGQ